MAQAHSASPANATDSTTAPKHSMIALQVSLVNSSQIAQHAQSKRSRSPLQKENIDIASIPRNIYISSKLENRAVQKLQKQMKVSQFSHKDFKPEFLNDPSNEYAK